MRQRWLHFTLMGCCPCSARARGSSFPWENPPRWPTSRRKRSTSIWIISASARIQECNSSTPSAYTVKDPAAEAVNAWRIKMEVEENRPIPNFKEIYSESALSTHITGHLPCVAGRKALPIQTGTSSPNFAATIICVSSASGKATW